VTIELLTYTRARVWCDVRDCFRIVEFEIRLDVPNEPTGWREAESPDVGWRQRIVRVTTHFCPDHADLLDSHGPLVMRRCRFLRSSLWATACECGRMPEVVAERGDKMAWVDHLVGARGGGTSTEVL
jgi:hypothetical protein